MASSPIWTGTPKCAGAVVASVANTVFTGGALTTSSFVTVLTGGTSGSKVQEIVIQGTGTTLSGVLDLFLYNGSTYYRFDQFYIPANTASTTANAYRASKTYQNLILADNTWSIVAASQIANQLANVMAFYGNF